jgi:hypothetical protein
MNILSAAEKEFQEYAKDEEIEVRLISGTLYAYGSELACLRLANQYRNSGDRAKCDWSKNLNTWFFRLEM